VGDDLAALVGRELADELGQALGRVEHCVGQLTGGQVWWKPRADLNCIGNLVVHMAGNVRQLIVSGVGGAADVRDRPAEFEAQPPLSRAELLGLVRAAVQDAQAALTSQTADEWARMRTVQGKPTTGLGAAVRSVAHFRGHTQEIIHITRTLAGDAYRFAGPPPGRPATK
jgi:hypothetical protein